MLKDNWVTNRTSKPFYLRKTFILKNTPEQAVLSVTGVGQFNVFINGNKPSPGWLEPAWTDYRKQVLYRRYDVSTLLKKGSNILLEEIGNGWYIWDQSFGYSFHFPPFMPPNPNPYQPFGECLAASFELNVKYPDGSEETIISDEQCRVKPHGVISTNVYGSEKIIGSLLETGCQTTDYDDSDWEFAVKASEREIPQGQLALATIPEIRTLKRYEGKKIGTVQNRSIYDLGVNIAGILSATVVGKAEQEVNFFPAEKLDQNGDADLMAKNWMPIDNVISYTIKTSDTPETFSQTFTYFSGRYIAVSGNAEILSLSADAISSAWQESGTFTCDDERYNQIYAMIERTVEANMMGVHTDCPTIERFAWQEPNHLMAPSIFFMKNGKSLWEKFFSDLRLSQHTASDQFTDMEGKPFCPGDGLVPSQAPCYIPNVLPVPGMGSFYDIIPWGSTSIIGVKWHYLFYGDVSVIQDNYAMGMRYLAHLKTRMTEDGFLCHGLGDWGNPEQVLARENIETAFLYADAITLAQFADILGKTDDFKNLSQFAETIKNNYNEKLLSFDRPLGVYCYHIFGSENEISQSAEALPLFWGMVPKEKEADVARALRHAIETKEALVAGEIGLPYVIQCARKYGMNDLIASAVTRPTHPSYYAFILDGETTLGEYWESNPRSHCHDMMGHIIEWYYNGIAGIEPLSPGFSSIRVEPYLPDGMNRFVCTYETPHGVIKISGRREDGVICFEAEVPEKITVTASPSVTVIHR